VLKEDLRQVEKSFDHPDYVFGYLIRETAHSALNVPKQQTQYEV